MQDEVDEDGNPSGMKMYGFVKPLDLQADGHPFVTR